MRGNAVRFATTAATQSHRKRPAKGNGLATGLAVTGLALAVLAGCSREEILEGERLDLRAPWGESSEVANRALPVSLPAQATNAGWTHRQGNASGRPTHPALSSSPQLIWSAPIGQGDGRRVTLATDPVVGGGVIYTLDAHARVQATSASSGEVLWSRDLTPDWARQQAASGGGLALADGRLYVTSAFAFAAALDAGSGEVVWRHRFDAPITGAPAVQGDRVFVASGDSSLWALDTANGRIDWTRRATESITGMARGAAPAISGDNVIFPTQAGELVAVRRANGAVQWTGSLAGRRVGAARANVSSITGDPVVDGARVYAANQAGRLAAFETRTGRQLWSAREGAEGPVWPVGGSIFLVSDENRLMRLDAESGTPIWAHELPRFATDRPRRQARIFTQHGPVLAGGRLWVAAGDGPLRGFDPASGEQVIELQVPRGAASAPIVAGGTMFVLGRGGQLHAFR